MESLFDALDRLKPLLYLCMVIGIWICVITACLHVKQWKEDYKTLGNVPIEDAINVAAMIYIACMLYKQIHQEDKEKDKIRLIRIALHEHDKEKA